MDLSSRCWFGQTLIRSRLRTYKYDAFENTIDRGWGSNGHLQTRRHVMIQNDYLLLAKGACHFREIYAT